jgi:pimeloyl-ACP methyl ester carboxylesterase
MNGHLRPDFDWRSYRREGQLADLGDVRIWYDEEGRGAEPLVLLGGFGAGHYIWDFVWPLLHDFHRITLEPRGLGRSDRPPPPYGVDVWADDLRRLLDYLGVERAHLWATGFGTYYAVRFIAKNPERVNRFVGYTDVWAGDPSKGYAEIWRSYGSAIEESGTTRDNARKITARTFDVPWLPWFADWEAENLAMTMHRDTAAATAGYCLTEVDVREDLDRVRVPTLVLQGDHGWGGEPIPPEEDYSLQEMQRRIPGLRSVVIPDSHSAYVIAHKPEECSRIVREFLQKGAT